jgi:hypothetical protein
VAARTETGFARRHRRLLVAAAIGIAAVVAFVLVYFQPQKLFINKTVNEELPVPVASVGASIPAGGAAQAVVLRSGRFRSGEHHTEGLAQLLRVPDHSLLLRLTDFRTSNGPAVHVWLSSAPAGSANGEVARSSHIDLGSLKGNIGNQSYRVAREVHVSDYSSAVIWCERFSVTFGAAPLS